IANGAAVAETAQKPLRILEVARQSRSDVRVQHRGGDPVVLANLRSDVHRQRQVGLRHRLLHEPADGSLVILVVEGPEKAYRNRRDLLAFEDLDRAEDVLFDQRSHNAAELVDALTYRDAEVSGHKDRGRRISE